MSGPANSTTSRDGAREYTWPPGNDDAEVFQSVTTLLKGGVPKPALIYWATSECANYVFKNYELIGHAKQGTNGYKDATRLVREAPWNSRDAAADMGTLLHEYAEARAQGISAKRAFMAMDLGEVDATKFERYAHFWEMWLDEWKPEFERTEFTIYNRRYHYAGTGDLIARFKGHGLALCDYKTSKKGKQGHGIYPETALQLSAYAHGEFIGQTNGTEAPMPEVDTLLAINVRHDGYHVIQAEHSERVYRAFIYATQVAQFVAEGKAFLSTPLAPPIREAAS